MPRSFDDAAIDAAAEDPPLLPLAGAAIGILLVGVALLSVALSMVTTIGLPIGSPVILVVIGVVLFVGSMILWNPGV